MLSGGLAHDIFDFNAVGESGKTLPTRDRITDFQHLTDDIDLFHIDAKAGIAGNQAFSFIGTGAFAGAKGQLHYKFVGAATIVEGDVDGNKVADFQIELSGHKVLTREDFIL